MKYLHGILITLMIGGILIAMSMNRSIENFEEEDAYKDYHIICANYTKPTDFLQAIPINHTVMKKGIDVPNKAHEASSFLRYIVDNYDTMPPNMIFIHDEDESWHHSGKISENIEDWIQEYHKEGGQYYEFNNKTFGVDTGINIPDNLYGENKAYKEFWDGCMKDRVGEYADAAPNSGKCCAQFIVSKERVQKHPKEFYQTMYDWLINKTSGEGNGDPADLYSSYNTGRYAEWSWFYIFGK